MTATLSTEDTTMTASDLPADRPMDNTSAILDTLLHDVTTYRFWPGMKISPAMASRIISLNAANNRNLKPTSIEQYANAMRVGQWIEETGETIKIDKRGRLIDGQQRMHAVVKSGATLRWDVAIGVNDNAMMVVDSGAARNAADQLGIATGDDVTKPLAAIVRWVWCTENGSPRGATGGTAPNPVEMIRRYQETPAEFAAAAARAYDARKIGTQSAMGTGYYLLRRAMPTEAMEFFDSFISGANLPLLCAQLELRTTLGARKRPTPSEQLALLIRAFNRYNTFNRDTGNRVKVYKLQITRTGPLTNANFPRPFTRTKLVTEVERPDVEPADDDA